MTTQTKTAVGIVAVIAILVGGSWLLTGKNQADNLAAVGSADNNNRLGITSEGKLEVSDQLPGTVVYVKNVNLPQGGWVVIHQPDSAGLLGPVIGYEYFDPLTHAGTVTLTAPTVEGGQYLAVLYADNGNKIWDVGALAPDGSGKDQAMTNASGLLIGVSFRATADLPEIKG